MINILFAAVLALHVAPAQGEPSDPAEPVPATGSEVAPEVEPEAEGATEAEGEPAPEVESEAEAETGLEDGAEPDTESAPVAPTVAAPAPQDERTPPEPPSLNAAPVDKFTLAVMDVEHGRGIDDELTQAITQSMTRELEAMGVFEAISNEDIRQMLKAQQEKELMGCDTASCLSEIASALGAEFTVFGSLVLLDGTYLLQLQLVQTDEARTLARSQREFEGSATELIDVARGLLKVLVRDLLAQRSGTLDLAVSESDATVQVDGVIVGATPLPPLLASGGFHTVTIEKKGFVRFTQDVEVKQDQISSLQVRLTPSAQYKEEYLERAWTWRIGAWSGLGLAGATAITSVAALSWAVVSTTQLNEDVVGYNANPTMHTTENYNQLQTRSTTLFVVEVVAGVLAVAAAGVGAGGAAAYFLGDDPWHFANEGEGEGEPSPPEPVALGQAGGRS